MALFESFSFSASERHPSSYSRHVLQVSPLSTPTSAYEPAPSSRRHSQAISDLAHKFSEQKISKPLPPISTASYFDIPVSESAPPVREPSPQRERSWSPPLGGYRRLSASAIRAQRQANIRLLSDSSHLRELSALVEQMVDSGSQCRVCTPPSPTTTISRSTSAPTSMPQSPVDEAIDGMDCLEDDAENEDYPSSTLKFRRSSDFGVASVSGTAGPACVRKDVRIRKQRRHKTSTGR